MKLVLGKRKLDFDVLMLCFLLTNLLLLVFINEGQKFVEWGSTGICLICIAIKAISQPPIRRKLYGFAFFIGYLLFVTLLNGKYTYLFSNIISLFQPFIIFLYLCCLSSFEKEKVEAVIERHYLFFNIYYFVNFVFMLYQIQTDVLYDNITGFIGVYGTHRLTAFVVFLVLLNIRVISQHKNLRKTWALILLTLLIVISSIWISSINDNTALYILLPLVVLLYFFASNRISAPAFFEILIVIAVVALVWDRLMDDEDFRYYLENRLFSKIQEFSMILKNGELDEERMAYVNYAVEHLNGKSIGVGLGQFAFMGDKDISDMDISLRNWGMSNISSLIGVGGIWFMVAYAAFFAYIMAVPAGNWRVFFSFVLIFLILIYYSQPVNSIPMITAVWLMLYPFMDNRSRAYTLQQKKEEKS